MATDTAASTPNGPDARAWLSGAIGGVLGAIVIGVLIQIGIDPAIIAEDLPAVLGTAGPAIGWAVLVLFGAVAGLIYAGLGTVERVRARIARPSPGSIAGLVYGLVLWIVFAIAMSTALGETTIGQYPFTAETVLAFALFGVVLGIVHGASPYTGR